MNFDQIMQVISIILSILLIITVLIQQRGSGIGGAFGGSSTVYRTRRGAEKFIFRSTIILAILFCLSALVTLIF